MHNYVAVIFDNTSKAYEALHALWLLDGEGEITVHGTAVVHRNSWGHFQVDSKETHPALATAVGVGIGALLGLLAGPAGIAAGAASGAALGAAVGGSIGVTADLFRADDREGALRETAFILRSGHSAVIADISEDSTSAVNAKMRELGGELRRRDWGAMQSNSWLNEYIPTSYLYPYEYVPSQYAY